MNVNIKATTLGLLLITVFNLNAQTLDTAHLNNSKRLRISPLPIVYYSPETKLGIGALVALNFSTNRKKDTLTKGSFSQNFIIYTMNKQYNIGNQSRIYFPKNKYIFNSKFNYKYFPEFYFGSETEQPKMHKDSIEYNNTILDLRGYKKIGKGIYLGLITRFNKVANIKSGEGHFIQEKPLGYLGYWELGFAPAFTIETRDNFVFPSKGYFLELAYFMNPSWQGKSYQYNQVKIDYRKYFPLKILSKHDVLAFQFQANISKGDVPFKDMSEIGGAYSMRGYYTGFYRYKNMYSVQSELRTTIYKCIGAVCWFGGAFMPQKWYNWSGIKFKPNAGIGLRITINKKDKLNLRLDQGFGNQNQNGFYLDVAEAF